MAHSHNEFRSLSHYEGYYLDGGDLYFLVEEHVFRIHRYFFVRESAYFEEKLAKSRQGTSDRNAIVLDDVRAHNFAQFLWVFYNPKFSIYNTSVANWVEILTLAHQWSFPQVKALAVREIEKLWMPDIERVAIYQDNGVDHDLLTPWYAALCERDEPITPSEGGRLGIETALTIAKLREMARRSPVDLKSPIPANFHGNGLYELVREVFGIAAPITEDSLVPDTPLDSSHLASTGAMSTTTDPTSLTIRIDDTDDSTHTVTHTVVATTPNGHMTGASPNVVEPGSSTRPGNIGATGNLNGSEAVINQGTSSGTEGGGGNGDGGRTPGWFTNARNRRATGRPRAGN